MKKSFSLVVGVENCFFVGIEKENSSQFDKKFFFCCNWSAVRNAFGWEIELKSLLASGICLFCRINENNM